MEKSSEIIKNTITFENFEALLKEGILPGEVPLNQLVRLLDAANLKMQGHADETSVEELTKILGKEDRARAVHGTFRAHRIPLKEKTVKEIKETFAMLDELEEISDGLCEYLLRNGVDPTIYNMVRLQHERQSIMPVHVVTRKNTVWSFSDTKTSYETDEIKIIEQAGLPVSDTSKEHLKWLNEKGIYVSEQNLRLLYALRSIRLPIGDEEVARLFIESIKDGRGLRDSLLCKTDAPNEERTLFRKTAMKDETFPKEIFEYLRLAENTECRKVLREFENAYHKEYLKNHSETEYKKEEYRTFFKDLDAVGDEVSVLNALIIPITTNHLAAMRYLTSPEGEAFFEKLAFFIGGKELAAAFERGRKQSPEESGGYEKACRILYDTILGKKDDTKETTGKDEASEVTAKEAAGEEAAGKATDEKEEETRREEAIRTRYGGNNLTILKECIFLCKILLFMDELKSRGFEEIPVLLGRRWIRVRLKKEGEGNFSALTQNDVTGGFLIKYVENPDSVQVIVVGEREVVLEEFKASGLLSRRLKKAGKKEVSVTYLHREEFAFGEHFYPSF